MARNITQLFDDYQIESIDDAREVLAELRERIKTQRVEFVSTIAEYHQIRRASAQRFQDSLILKDFPTKAYEV